MTDNVNVARERVEAFLKVWVRRSGNGDIIYGMGVEDDVLELTVSDLRALIASTPKAELLSNPQQLDEHSPEKKKEWLLADRAGVIAERDRAEAEVERLQSELSALRAQPEAKKGEQVAWRPVVGFEGRYEVSAFGDIRNVRTGNIQAKNTMGRGYIKADLWKDGARTQTSVHRVVADAFLPKRNGLNEVNHIDGDKTNNAAWNLEWTDRKGNTDHSRYVLGNDIKPVLATDPTTGAQEYFPSIEEAGRSGYNASGIYDALNGRKHTHGGKTWSFTEWRGPHTPHPAPSSELLEAADFLADRVTDHEHSLEADDFYGHVLPALARYRLAKHKGPQS